MVFSAHGVQVAVVNVYQHLPSADHLLCYTGMSDTVASVGSSSQSSTRGLLRKTHSHSASGSGVSDIVTFVGGSSPSPTRGLLRKAHSHSASGGRDNLSP